MKKTYKFLATLSLIGIATLSAVAQTRGNAESRERIMSVEKMQKRNFIEMNVLREKKMVNLKTKLKITPEQETAWNTFHEAMKPDEKMGEDKLGERKKNLSEMQTLSTPERIEKMENLRKQHMTKINEKMEKRGNSIKNFYAVLTEEQKKIFDKEYFYHPFDRQNK